MVQVDAIASMKSLRDLELDWVSWRVPPPVRRAITSSVKPTHVGGLLRRLSALTNLGELRLRTAPNLAGADDQRELSTAIARNLDRLELAMPMLMCIRLYDLEQARFVDIRIRK
jgi:hypothetical protein